MPEFSSSLSLREILRYCSDRDSPYFDYAWKEFLGRYESYIYAQIRKACIAWRSDRLKLQLEETVEDLFTKIMTELCAHDFKSLREFHGSANDEEHERMFKAWLRVICHNQANRELKKKWWQILDKKSPEELMGTLGALGPDVAWALYDEVVSLLRDPKRSDTRERDIHIFLLATFGACPEAMIRVPYFMKKLGSRVIQVVINRMRARLRRFKDLFF